MTNAVHIVPLRKGGLGLVGTYANMDHHAQAIKPFVDALAPLIPSMRFKNWQQGHNIHVFETEDGRKFDLVPLRVDGKYAGIRLRARQSRSVKMTLCDCDNISRITQLAVVLQALSRPIGDNTDTGGGISD